MKHNRLWPRLLLACGLLLPAPWVNGQTAVQNGAPGKPGFDQLFQESGVVMLLIDPDSGLIMDANPAAEAFYGYAPGVLRGMAIQQINTFTPSQVAAERQLAKSEARNFFYFRHRLANGEIVSVEVHSNPYLFDGRRLLLSIVHNITPARHQEKDLWHYQQRLEEMVDAQVREIERGRVRFTGFLFVALLLQALVIFWLVLNIRQRRRLEAAQKATNEALKESERLFRGLFEQAAVGVAQIDSNSGRFVRVNQACGDIFGYGREELQRLDFQTIAHPDDLARDRLEMERLKQGEIEQYTLEQRYLTKSGDTVWVNLAVSPMWSKGETPTHHVAIVDNISARREAEQALRESELRYRQVFNQQFLLASMLNPEGRVIDINDLSLNVQGIHREQCVGRPYWEIPAWRDLPDWRQTIQERVMRAAQMDAPLQAEDVYHDAAGSLRHAESAYAAVRSTDGRLLYIVVQAFDITERKRTEQKVRAQIQELRAWQELMLNREDRVIELKQEVDGLLLRAGEPPRYGTGSARTPTQ